MEFTTPTNNWSGFFEAERNQEYYGKLMAYLDGKKFYPPPADVFRCFFLTDLGSVKVVIIGQDPYHNVGQAMGMSFSVPNGTEIPPSLMNIYKEIRTDTGIPTRNTGGDLTEWAKQGVLLLNTVLTVAPNAANSHKGQGWEHFTDNCIGQLNLLDKPVVYMLWGRNAQEKRNHLDNPRHLVLTAPHPSPLSAYSGFFGCRHFSKCNAFLAKNGEAPIKW